jgi:hypothetical protein
MKASVVVLISGTSNAWKVAEPSDALATVQRRTVSLEIKGDTFNGYSLIMAPSGCFTADSWHETLEDAMDTAHRLFDVTHEDWK